MYDQQQRTNSYTNNSDQLTAIPPIKDQQLGITVTTNHYLYHKQGRNKSYTANNNLPSVIPSTKTKI